MSKRTWKHIGLFKPRMIFGIWWLHLCDFDHTVLEIRGPFKWADMEQQMRIAASQRYKKEQ